MGMTLDMYPPANLVLAAHADALSRLPPTPTRRHAAAMLAETTEGRWPDAFRRYRALPR